MSSEPNLFLEGGGEFGVTCLLLLQKYSNIFTVIICLKYNEADERKLFLK